MARRTRFNSVKSTKICIILMFTVSILLNIFLLTIYNKKDFKDFPSSFKSQTFNQTLTNNESSIPKCNNYKNNDSSTNFSEFTKRFKLTELPEETAFPLAYSIIVYKEPNQVYRLLRAIYRPSNFYCIHVDKKASPEVWLVIKEWIECLKPFSNLIVPEDRINVQHSEFSVLEAELVCARHLFKQFKSWRYYINLTGQEWPLKTNLELVRILKAMNGSNIMNRDKVNEYRLPKDRSKPPHRLKLYKGYVHVLVIRKFVQFMLYNNKALDLLEYLKKTEVPDETYFSTLNHNPHLKAPGGYTGKWFGAKDYPLLMRLKHWDFQKKQCNGFYLRLICIWGDKDVPFITDKNRKELFVNKFIIGKNDGVLAKVEEWFWNHDKCVYEHPESVNVNYYKGLKVVKHHTLI